MRRIFMRSLLTLVALSVVISSFAFATASSVAPTANKANNVWAMQFKDAPEVKALSPDMLKLGIDQFLSLTPSKYKKLTGHKLGLKKSIELKAAQKLLKKRLAAEGGTDIPKGLYIVMAIFGFGWLAMGLMDDFKGNDWWVNLLLTLLCWLPGVIHALVKMKKYYN